MTTFPGKPTHDEATDSNWGSAGEEAEREAAAAPREDSSRSDSAPPVYGVGVPYGGNDRTEEVEPIALDMPFSPEQLGSAPGAAAPAAAPEPVIPAPVVPGSGAPVAGRRTPVPRSAPPLDAPAQLALSDLFDSTPPPSSSLVPPDPAAFSTPPPRSRWSKEPRPSEPRAAEPPSPWTVSRPNGDAQYFAGGPALAGAADVATPPRGSAVPPPASARGADPVATGGVVALPSINVLAEPQRGESQRAESRRPSSLPVVDRADLIDDFKATLPRPISLRAPGRVALLDDLKETAPRPIAGRASTPPAAPAAAAPAEGNAAQASSEPALSTRVYSDEPDPTSKVFLDSLPEQLGDEDVAPLPSEPPPAVAAQPPRPAAPQVAPQRSSPRTSPTPFDGGDDDLKATLQRPLPQGLLLEQEEREPATQRRRESEPPHRRSVPTLESVGNAAARALGSSVDAGVGSDEVVRFPSDVPTSRPPEVALGTPPESAPAERKSRPGAKGARAPVERRPVSPPQSVLAMLPSTKTQQLSLPSVMVADDVEAEHDSAAQRRALRAARQTVRIELPANFGRPGSALVPGLLPGTSTALPAPESELTGRASRIKRHAPWVLAGLLLVAAVLLLVMRPRSGSLVVTALGAGHRAVESVQIFVDGKPLCDSSPCRISGLSAGAHQLRATAPGMASEELTVEISSGEEAATNIELRSTEPAGSARAAAAAPAGEPRPARREKVVVTIQLSPESEGASVTLDDAFLLDFPAELELEPRSTHTLTATKPGFEDYTLQLELGDETEKQIEVSLTPQEGASQRPRARARSATAGASAQASARKSATPVSRPASPQADATQGLLNISSTPPSQIILNGRPLGSTPKTAVVVPGDSLQTIVFVHPKMGRRRAQKFVPAGKERTVSIRF